MSSASSKWKKEMNSNIQGVETQETIKKKQQNKTKKEYNCWNRELVKQV